MKKETSAEVIMSLLFELLTNKYPHHIERKETDFGDPSIYMHTCEDTEIAAEVFKNYSGYGGDAITKSYELDIHVTFWGDRMIGANFEFDAGDPKRPTFDPNNVIDSAMEAIDDLLRIIDKYEEYRKGLKLDVDNLRMSCETYHKKTGRGTGLPVFDTFNNSSKSGAVERIT